MLGKALLPEFQELIRERKLDDLREQLLEVEVADIAEILEDLPPEDEAVLFRLLPRETAADVFEHLPFENQEQLLRKLSTENLSHLLNSMAPDDRTRLFEELPAGVTRRLLKTLEPDELRIARTLLGYPEESIGRLMTPEYVAARPEMTVAETFQVIREESAEAEIITYIYVVEENGRLADDLHLGVLVRADPSAKLSDLVEENFVALSPYDDWEEAVAAFRKYDRIALPVVDDSGRMLGIVTFDDVMDVEEIEATEDAQKFGGQSGLEESYFATTNLTLIRKRAGWLVFLFFGGFLTGWAMEYFDELLAQFLMLSFFVPLVISSGGNSGSQSAATIIRGLAVQEFELSDWWRVFLREVMIGFALGAFLGVILAGRVLLASPERPGAFAAIMFLAVTGIVTFGSVIGAMLPFFFKRLGVDPAHSSGPFIATFVDVSGLLLYFSLASRILNP